MATTSPAALPLPAETGLLRPAPSMWRRLVGNRRARLGAVLLLLLYLSALLAPFAAPYDPNRQVLLERLKPPTQAHPFGTDNFGRDSLSRMLWAGRVSLSLSLLAAALTTVIGLLLGLVAGYAGGWADNLIMRATDVFLAFPIFLLLITVVAIYGSNVVLLVVFLGLSAWPSTARVVRAEVLSLRAREFVQAARLLGARDVRVMLVHILPNVVPVLVVAATIRVATVILTEAGLSYLGLGVPPPTATWGGMVADGRAVLESAWWVTTFPGLLVVLAVLAYNLLGDGLRDVLDPRRRLADQ